jgi:hypothetical protein
MFARSLGQFALVTMMSALGAAPAHARRGGEIGGGRARDLCDSVLDRRTCRARAPFPRIGNSISAGCSFQTICVPRNVRSRRNESMRFRLSSVKRDVGSWPKADIQRVLFHVRF